MNKVSDIREAKSAERQASEWLVLMEAGDPSSAERARFEAWLADPGHRAAYAEVEGTWSRLRAMGGHARARGIDVPAEPKTVHRTSPGRSRFARHPAAWTAAASLLLALLAGMYLYPRTLEMQYATIVGERRTVILQDGSKVELNTDTALSVTYSASLRQVMLRRGEAYFDVTGNRSKPFVVTAGPGAIRAVGTGFAVRLISAETVAVTVAEGTVEVTHADRARPGPAMPVPAGESPPTLGRGQRAELDQRVIHIEDLPLDELARSQAWRQGMLVFDGQSLEEVIREVARYTETRLIISDDTLKDLRIGGVFEVGDIDALLEVLEQSFDIHISRSGERAVYLHSSRASRTRRSSDS